jgi:bifunctional non-homologous end joining protein LigD
MGCNFSNRFPQIVAALTVQPVRSCLIDGEAVVCNESGLAVFELIGGCHDAAAVLFAFDLLELDGEDLRRTPIEERKRILAKLLNHPPEGIVFNERYTGDGAIIFKQGCALGCEGIVSKRLLAVSLGPSRSLGESQKPGGTRFLVNSFEGAAIEIEKSQSQEQQQPQSSPEK